jgi:nucleotide-binding universal stress UspA family protein
VFWPIMIKKILVPVNLAFTEPALLAVRLACFFRAEIIFFHCLPASAFISKFFFPKALEGRGRQEISLEERRHAEEKISAFELDLPLGDLRHSWKIAKGIVLQEILKAADSLRPDWIIQGSRRLSGLEEWIPGGIPWWTIQKASCPVITVKHLPSVSGQTRHLGAFHRDHLESHPETCGAQPPSLRKILYLSGSGESSSRALPDAAAIAKKSSAELIILHVVDEPRKKNLKSGRHEEDDPAVRLQRLVAKARTLQTELNVSSTLVVGNPEEAVLSRIHEDDTDMVVMGIAHSGGLGIIPAGIFRDRIFHRTTCPIMTINRNSAGLEKRYQKLFQKLTPKDLIQVSEEHPEAIGEDLFSGRRDSKSSDLFLKHYSNGGLIRIFEEYGLLALLREKGFTEPKIAINLDDPYRQRLRVYFGEIEDERHTLIEMILRDGILEAPHPKETPHRGHYFPVLMVEWLCMQNPTVPFSPERPPLPDQRYPGLGMSREILELISLIGMRIGKDGIAIHPRFFHAAVIYHRLFKCYNPVQEGQLTALIRDTEEFNLNDVSWAITLDCLGGTSLQQKASWEIDYQVHPLTGLLQQHFHSENYRNLFWNSLANHHYHINWKQLDKRLGERIKTEDAAP